MRRALLLVDCANIALRERERERSIVHHYPSAPDSSRRDKSAPLPNYFSSCCIQFRLRVVLLFDLRVRLGCPYLNIFILSIPGKNPSAGDVAEIIF